MAVGGVLVTVRNERVLLPLQAPSLSITCNLTVPSRGASKLVVQSAVVAISTPSNHQRHPSITPSESLELALLKVISKNW